jgi:hypothetical protein
VQSSSLSPAGNSTTELSSSLELQLHAGFVLLSQKQCHRTVLPEACVGDWDPKLPLPAGLVVPSMHESHRIALPEVHAGSQTLEHLLPTGFVLLRQQQLPLLLEAHTPIHVDPRATSETYLPFAAWVPSTCYTVQEAYYHTPK